MTPRPILNSQILIVEDNIGDARLIAEMLKEIDIGEFDVTYIQDLKAVETLSKTKFKIILLDLHLSDSSPVDTFKQVDKLFPRTPIIVLTGLEDNKLASRIVRLGAQDYLIKGTFDTVTLERSMRYAVDRKQSQIKIAREKVRTKSFQTKADNFEEESHRLLQINKAKDVFLSIASHQLRTPATAVKQYVGMLLEGYAGPLDPKQETFLRTAYESNERQLRIVDDLLKVARLDAGHVTLHKQPTDIEVLIKSLIEDHEQSFETRKQTVKYIMLSNEVGAVEIDPDNMRMVFDNLLDNAGKYSPPGSEVTIYVNREKTKLKITFQDQGIGISKDDQKKLFQKFSRIDNSFAYSPNGSGLGLYWAREIVRLHEGTVTLESKLGVGSTFTVELPC